MLIKLRKAQGATEYAIFIAAVLIGFIALQVYYQRAVKGNIKQRADSVGDQFTANAVYSSQSVSQSVRSSDSGFTTVAAPDGTNSTAWSNSKILGSAGSDFETKLRAAKSPTKGKAADIMAPLIAGKGYAGVEYSSSDYISQGAANTGVIGTHATMKSGDIANTNPMQDANLAGTADRNVVNGQGQNPLNAKDTDGLSD